MGPLGTVFWELDEGSLWHPALGPAPAATAKSAAGSSKAEVCWTKTDEAPLLATYSLYPIVCAFSKSSGVNVAMKDISVAGRVIANFPENLSAEQKIPDDLVLLGELAKTPAANIIKLPNI